MRRRRARCAPRRDFPPFWPEARVPPPDSLCPRGGGGGHVSSRHPAPAAPPWEAGGLGGGRVSTPPPSPAGRYPRTCKGRCPLGTPVCAPETGCLVIRSLLLSPSSPSSLFPPSASLVASSEIPSPLVASSCLDSPDPRPAHQCPAVSAPTAPALRPPRGPRSWLAGGSLLCPLRERAPRLGRPALPSLRFIAKEGSTQPPRPVAPSLLRSSSPGPRYRGFRKRTC